MLEVLFPLPCAGCAGRSAPAAPLCARCLARVPRAPVGAPPAGVDAWAAPFRYAGAIREVVARAKYRDARAALPWLAAQMVRAADAVALDAAVVTWIPTTAERRRGRGYDPAEVLARSVARQRYRPLRRVLTRLPGPPQTGRSASDRAIGPRYTVVRAAPVSVLLVDDVATTGATLGAAATALRAAGAARVVALVAARTPAPGTPG